MFLEIFCELYISIMIRFIAIMVLYHFVVPNVFAEEPGNFMDSVIYSSPEEVWKVWTPVMGEEAKGLLGVESGGIRLLDLTGDTYEAQNSQKAVFLRKPFLKPPYFFQATIDDLNPPERFGQAGLVAWKDADNYIRTTIGFNPAGMECLGEIRGRPHSRGVHGIYPLKNPRKTILRMEMHRRSIRGYLSFDGKYWLGAGGITLPGKTRCRDFIKGIGILGVAGGKTGLPIFSEWMEGSIPGYQDDEFKGGELGTHWMMGQTNGGWGKDKTRIYLKEGKLFIHPFPGSDIYLGNENYPYVSMPAPTSDSFTLEIRISVFNGLARGRWNKAGVVFWQDFRHFIILSLVADEDDDRMFFETISAGDKNPFSVIKRENFLPRDNTEVVFRFTRKDVSHYEGYAFLDSNDPIHMGTFENPLYEPQVRLFATGDVFMQYPDDHDFYAAFDYIRISTEK